MLKALGDGGHAESFKTDLEKTLDDKVELFMTIEKSLYRVI